MNLGVRNLKKKYQTAPTSPHVVWEGFFKKNSPSASKNNLWHIQLSDTTGTANSTGFYGQIKQTKKAFKYTAGSLMLWACFSVGGPGRLVQIHGIMDSIKYQQIKNLNLTASVSNCIMDRVWIFRQDNDPKQTSNQQKNVSLSTK